MANCDNVLTDDRASGSESLKPDENDSEQNHVKLNGTHEQVDVNPKPAVGADSDCGSAGKNEPSHSVFETIELPAPESSKLDSPPEIKSSLANGSAKPMCDASSQTSKTKGSNQSKSGFVRHIMAVLALSSIVLANMNRQAFNQALVSMIKPVSENPAQLSVDAGGLQNGTEQSLGTTILPVSDTTIQPAEIVDEPDFDDRFEWTGAQIGTLQAAFSYGYAPFMIPGGRMSELYGAKWVVFASGFGSALCCILSPFLADTNYILLVASRIIMGLSQTGVSPALYALLTRWLPPDESSVYLPMIKVAVMLGFMSGSLVSGFFSWRVTFYLVGTIGLIWSSLWVFLVSSDPRENRLIGERELDYIQREIRLLNKGRALSAGSSRKRGAPWLGILSNRVVIGFMLAKFTVKLSTDSQSMQIPMYFKHVFKISSELNGVLSATNFAIQSIFTGLVAWWAKELVVRKSYGLDKTGVRRIFQGVNSFGMGLAYILMTFCTSSLTMVCGIFVLLSASSMFGAGGEAVTPVDLSVEYSASIMAIANSLANLSGIVLPKVVSFILGNQLDSTERWDFVWWIVGGLSISGGFIYSCMVRAEIQEFRTEKKNNSKADDCGPPKAQKDQESTFIEMADTPKIE